MVGNDVRMFSVRRAIAGTENVLQEKNKFSEIALSEF